MTDEKQLTTWQRDKEGLLPAQVSFLRELATTLEPREAADTLSFKWTRIRAWLRSDKAFQTAYDDLFSSAREDMKREVALFADEAMDELFRLLKEEKSVSRTINCTKCGTKNTITVQVRDASVRAKVAELAQKMSGRLVDVRRLEGEMVHLTFYQKTALEKVRRGKPIGAQTRLELENMGLLDREVQQIPKDDVIVDAVVHDVTKEADNE